jgi:hypothetical protein
MEDGAVPGQTIYPENVAAVAVESQRPSERVEVTAVLATAAKEGVVAALVPWVAVMEAWETGE